MKTILCKIFDFDRFLLGQNKIIVRLELPLISLKYTPIPVVKCFSKRKNLFFFKDFYILPIFNELCFIKFEIKIPFLFPVSWNLQAAIPNKLFFKDGLMY